MVVLVNKVFTNILILAIITIVFGSNVSFGKSKMNLTGKDPLIKEDFQVLGIQVGMPLSEVTKILGKPKKVTNDSKKTICYYYPQLVIKSFFLEGVTDRTIDYLLINDKNIKTYRGIGIGDREKDVIYRYGKKDEILKRLIYETHFGDVDYYAINFLISNGKVKQVEIYMPAD